MATKTLVRLLVVLAIVGAVAAILHFAGGGGGIEAKQSSTEKRTVLSGFPINDVAAIAIQAKEGGVTLKKGESAWVVEERADYPANAESVADLLKDVWALEIGQPVPIGRSQYGRLNLVDPAEAESADEAATVLVFRDAEGKDLASLWLGKVFERSDNRPSPLGGMSTSEAGRYVKPGDSNSVYLVGETFDLAKTDPAEWLSEEFFKVDSVKSIAVDTGSAEDDWKLVRDDSTADFTLVNAKEGEEADGGKTASMKSAFANPRFEDVLVDAEAEENKTDKATFLIETFDGFTYTIRTGEKNDLNEMPLTVEVSGKFEEKRVPGEEESDEEKERLDKEFADDLAARKEKLETEQSFAGRVFKARSYLVDSILKKRSEILAEKEEAAEEEGKEVAPGITLPGLPEGATPAPGQ